jgi:hypothetical protein
MKKLIGSMVVLVFLSGCVTVPLSQETQEKAIQQGATWGAVGAVAGALTGVATKSDVGRAAAVGALAAGVPAMVSEIVKPSQAQSEPVVAPPLHLPGPKEIRISGYLEPELKWEVINELRQLGYNVTESYTAPLELRIEVKEESDPRIVAFAYLVDRPSGRIIAQGRSEISYFVVSQRIRIEKRKEAVVKAIRSLQ